MTNPQRSPGMPPVPPPPPRKTTNLPAPKLGPVQPESELDDDTGPLSIDELKNDNGGEETETKLHDRTISQRSDVVRSDVEETFCQAETVVLDNEVKPPQKTEPQRHSDPLKDFTELLRLSVGDLMKKGTESITELLLRISRLSVRCRIEYLYRLDTKDRGIVQTLHPKLLSDIKEEITDDDLDDVAPKIVEMGWSELLVPQRLSVSFGKIANRSNIADKSNSADQMAFVPTVRVAPDQMEKIIAGAKKSAAPKKPGDLEIEDAPQRGGKFLTVSSPAKSPGVDTELGLNIATCRSTLEKLKISIEGIQTENISHNYELADFQLLQIKKLAASSRNAKLHSEIAELEKYFEELKRIGNLGSSKAKKNTRLRKKDDVMKPQPAAPKRDSLISEMEMATIKIHPQDPESERTMVITSEDAFDTSKIAIPAGTPTMIDHNRKKLADAPQVLSEILGSGIVSDCLNYMRDVNLQIAVKTFGAINVDNIILPAMSLTNIFKGFDETKAVWMRRIHGLRLMKGSDIATPESLSDFIDKIRDLAGDAEAEKIKVKVRKTDGSEVNMPLHKLITERVLPRLAALEVVESEIQTMLFNNGNFDFLKTLTIYSDTLELLPSRISADISGMKISSFSIVGLDGHELRTLKHALEFINRFEISKNQTSREVLDSSLKSMGIRSNFMQTKKNIEKSPALEKVLELHIQAKQAGSESPVESEIGWIDRIDEITEVSEDRTSQFKSIDKEIQRYAKNARKIMRLFGQILQQVIFESLRKGKYSDSIKRPSHKFDIDLENSSFLPKAGENMKEWKDAMIELIETAFANTVES